MLLTKEGCIKIILMASSYILFKCIHFPYSQRNMATSLTVPFLVTGTVPLSLASFLCITYMDLNCKYVLEQKCPTHYLVGRDQPDPTRTDRGNPVL